MSKPDNQTEHKIVNQKAGNKKSLLKNNKQTT